MTASHPAGGGAHTVGSQDRGASSVIGGSLDAFTGRYAARTAGMSASEIRALFAVASRPEVVSLAGGMPFTSALPLDAVGKLLGELLATRGAQALQYGSGQGDVTLRELICEVMALEGIEASPDDVVVTVGGRSLDLARNEEEGPVDLALEANGSATIDLQVAGAECTKTTVRGLFEPGVVYRLAVVVSGPPKCEGFQQLNIVPA